MRFFCLTESSIHLTKTAKSFDLVLKKKDKTK